MVNKGYKVRSGKFSCFFPIGRGYVLSNAARNVPGLVVCVSFQSFFPHACINRYRFCCLRSCYGQTGLQHNFSSARGVYYSCFLSPTRVETKFHVISLGSWVDFFFFQATLSVRMQPSEALGAPASCRSLSLNSLPPAGPWLGIKTQHLAHQEETSDFSWGSCSVWLQLTASA